MKSSHRNVPGDSFYTIRDQETNLTSKIEFDFNCSTEKIIWAQQTFTALPFCLLHQRSEPILVNRKESAQAAIIILRAICENWENLFPEKALWSISRDDLIDIIRPCMLKENSCNEEQSSIVYAKTRLAQLSQALNTSMTGHLNGTISDSLGFPIDEKLKKQIMQSMLAELGIDYSEWLQGKSYPSIPLSIAAALLHQSIIILESYETKVLIALYGAFRKHPIDWQYWYSHEGDVLRRYRESRYDPKGIKAELENMGIMPLTSLPWRSLGSLNVFRRKLVIACMNILFIQSGYRYSEIDSTISTESHLKNGRLAVRHKIEKTFDGLKVSRTLPELSTKAALTLWQLSCGDARKLPLPLLHKTYTEECCNQYRTTGQVTIEKLKHFTFTKHLNAFYKEQIFSIIPEAESAHAWITTHQFRHTYAEFALRRFDEDVHVKLREHFCHVSDQSTRVYESKKLSREILSTLEKNYLYEVIGKVASGALDSRFWGPAFKRLQNELNKVTFTSIEETEEYYLKLCDSIDRFTAFEWGYCVLFKSSTSDAQCHNPVTGLPDVDGHASAERCTKCPNNMGNSIQKENLIRISISHVEIAETHSVRAIRDLSRDIAEQISRRIS